MVKHQSLVGCLRKLRNIQVIFPLAHIRSYVPHVHPYHHPLNLGYFQPDSLDPDGIIYSSSDLVVSFSITLGKIICVVVILSWIVKCNGQISLETKVIRPLCCGAFTSSVPNTLYIYKPQKRFLQYFITPFLPCDCWLCA